MNDVMIAADAKEESSKEAHDFVEMGTVTETTKGGFGEFYDGGIGYWKG